jgi:two-component system chemotaxis response regulator CheY
MPNFHARILVVDDFATMRRILKNTLKTLGYLNVEEADDGTTAWQALNREQFDLILCDWNMPKVNGLDFLKAVRANPGTRDIPFIMITAEAQKENILEAVKAGVSNYIIKPFTGEILGSKIEKVLK